MHKCPCGGSEFTHHFEERVDHDEDWFTCNSCGARVPREHENEIDLEQEVDTKP